jgi:hypothetical protein
MNILGIIASSKFGDAGDFESIATVTVGSGGAASAEFTSIPATYSHLQLRVLSRSSRSDGGDYLKTQFNSDTGSNYSWHRLTGDGSTVEAAAGASASQIILQRMASDYLSASIFSLHIIDILDYANTNKYKTVRCLAGVDNNSTDGRVDFSSGNWRNTNAITSIQLGMSTATNFKQYSQFALYGIRSA